MKIMLITLPKEGQIVDYTTPSFFTSSPVRYMPFGILAVAAGISSRHDVKILDSDSSDFSIDETVKQINEYAPDVLGISAVTRKAYAMSEILQRCEVPVKAVGGPHINHYAVESLALGATAVFKYDGDRNFNLWINDGCKEGIYEDYIDDINPLPFMRRSLLNLEDYVLNKDNADKTLLKKSGARIAMFSSKGCPFRCVFCDVQQKKFRWFKAERVVDEMELLISLGADSIHILDDCFNINRKRVLDICNEINKRKLKVCWSARGRLNLDDETAKALKSSGCNRLHIGVESLDNDVLRWMNKGITLEMIERFFDLCNKYEIEIMAYFILGSPVESREYRTMLPEMIRKFNIAYPYFNILYPASNTRYYKSLLESGIYKKDYWQEFAENPVPDYEIPLPRSPELQRELMETVERYIEEIYQKRT